MLASDDILGMGLAAFVMGAYIIYLICGQPKWGSKLGLPTVVTLSPLSRVLWILLVGIMLAGAIGKLLQYDVTSLARFVGPALIIVFALLILSGVRDIRRFRKRNDRGA